MYLLFFTTNIIIDVAVKFEISSYASAVWNGGKKNWIKSHQTVSRKKSRNKRKRKKMYDEVNRSTRDEWKRCVPCIIA